MRKHSLGEWILYILVRILMVIFCCLPVGVSLWIAEILGRCAYYLDLKHRQIVYSNLKRAFGSDKSSKELCKITKNYFINQYQNLIEVLRLPRLNGKYLEKYIEVEGKEYIFEALKLKKGLILLGVHFGNWEFSNVVCSNLGFDYYIFAQEQKMGLLDELLNSLRQAKGCKIQFIGKSMKGIMQALKKNACVGMVVDHGGRDGVLVDFFKSSARTPTGGVRLALRYNCQLIIGYIRRKRGPYHLIKFFPAFKIENTDDLEKDVRSNLSGINENVEQFIRQFPDQYLWHYKRWKYTDQRRVLILNDGKAGHLTQAKSILKIISHLNFKVTSKIVEVKYKNRLAKNILSLCSLFNSRNCVGCLSCVKFALTKDSFNELSKSFADIIVSAGSSTASVNLYLKREFNAKSICIMKPGISKIKDFELCILPRHDNIPKKSNTVIIDGACNLIDEEYLSLQKKSLLEILVKKNIKLREDANFLGLLIGGDTKYFRLSSPLIEKIIFQIKRLSKSHDLGILITTSRRTPKEIEDILKSNFKNDPHCKLLIIANEENYTCAVGGILGLSKVVVVSGESISMVSEAASCGKYVVVFKPEPRRVNLNRKSRHERFLNELENKNYIYVVPHDEFYNKLERILKTKAEIKKLDNSRVIQESLCKIL